MNAIGVQPRRLFDVAVHHHKGANIVTERDKVPRDLIPFGIFVAQHHPAAAAPQRGGDDIRHWSHRCCPVGNDQQQRIRQTARHDRITVR